MPIKPHHGWQLAIRNAAPSLAPPTCFLTPTSTRSNTMYMDGMDMGMMSMHPYLHFGGGDPLWFQAWAPTSSGAIAGACMGLVMLAMFERLLVGMRGILEAEWQRRSVSHRPMDKYRTKPRFVQRLCPATAEGAVSQHHAGLPTSIDPKPEGKESSQTSLNAPTGWLSTLPMSQGAKGRPFIPSHDVARGIVYLAQAAVAYTLMLAVM